MATTSSAAEAAANAAATAAAAVMLAHAPPNGPPAFAAAVFDAAVTLSGATSASRAPSLAPDTTNSVTTTTTTTTVATTDGGDDDHDTAAAAASNGTPVKRRRGKSKDAPSSPSLVKRRISFQHKWLSKYALRITSMDAVTSEVLVLACRLCEKYGREKVALGDDGAPKTKRRITSNVKHFKPPWRSDNIAHHVRNQHARRFAEYDALTEKQKEVFLEYTGPPQSDSDAAAAAAAHSRSALLLSSSAASALGLDAADAHGELFGASPTAAAMSATTLSTVTTSSNGSGSGSGSGSGGHYRERVVCLVDAPIVDTVIADLLLDVDSEYGALVHDPVQARAIFARHVGAGRSADRCAYVVTAPSRLELELCLRFVATGASLRMCASLFKDAQMRAPRTRLSAVSTATVVGFVRMAAAMNLQVLASVLEQSWAFSLVLDAGDSDANGANGATHLDVRVRVALATQLCDFHVLALPTLERHSRQYVFDSLSKLLSALHAGWEHKLVGIVPLGAPRVTARFSDVVARLHQSTSDGCYRVWSGAQQLERVLQRLFRQLFDEAFVNHVAALTGYLRSQSELTAALGGRACPRFIDTSWRAMTRLIDWFAATRVDVKSYLDAKRPACAPPAKWWVLMAALKRFCDIVANALSKIAGLTAQLAQQRECINALLRELIDVAYVRGPYENHFDTSDTGAAGAASDDGQRFIFGQYYATHRGTEALLEDLDPFVFELLETLKKRDAGAYLALVANVAFIFGETVSELSKAMAERSSLSLSGGSAGGLALDAVANVPSVLPHELVRLSGAGMNRLLRTQQLRLLASFSSDEASAIHNEHAQLKTAYARDAAFKAQIDVMSSAWSFDRAWSGVGELYPRLRRFCGGLATAFPSADGSTSTTTSLDSVSAAAPVVGYERSELRSSLVDFELEAILHARQYPALQDIASRMGF